MKVKYEHVLSINKDKALPLHTVDLAKESYLEREHLQEWLIANPQILGEDVMIVTSEFDRWKTALGDKRKDRLDILAMDSGGRLIVAELKRDKASNDVELQALKYAALVSRFTEDTLVEAHQRFLMRRAGGRHVEEADARLSLETHIDGELDKDSWLQPLVVLIANDFPETVTNTVVWLSEAEVDITLLRYQLYRTSGDPLLVITQTYPLPDSEEFLLAPRREEVKQSKERAKERQKLTDSVKRIIAYGGLEPGTPLTLTPKLIREEIREEVLAWVHDNPLRGQAIWTNEVAAPLRWAYTGETGKPSTFAAQAIKEATGEERPVRGPIWWSLEDGTDLATLADQLQGDPPSRRDWSDLHELLASVPAGKWTTYGDLAKAIGTAPQPLGQHVTACPDCPNAHRVLQADGRVSDGFRWTDPEDTRDPVKLLSSEGVDFVLDGRASPNQRYQVAGHA